MPCNSDHCRPSLHETISKELAEMLYSIGFDNQAIIKAKDSIYGNNQRMNEWTQTLCSWCRKNEKLIIDNLIERRYRILLLWWEDHQEVDRKRLEHERMSLGRLRERIEKDSKEYEDRLKTLKKEEAEIAYETE